MKTEVRFLLAIFLMLGVLVGTNLLFPPDPIVDPEVVEEERVWPDLDEDEGGRPGPERPADPMVPDVPDTREPAAVLEEQIVVEGPRYRYEFSNIGARLHSLELVRFRSFTREDAVQLIPEDEGGAFARRVLVGSDTIDFGAVPFEVFPSGGLRLEEGGAPQSLEFTYRGPEGRPGLVVEYLFDPDSYMVEVSGRVLGVERGVVFSDLGSGLAFNETDPDDEARSMAWVANHLQEGIRSQDLSKVTGMEVVDGPFHWVAFRSKYFLLATLAGQANEDAPYLGGLIARDAVNEHSVDVEVTQSLATGGVFTHQIFAGPQDLALLSAVGFDLKDVNPIGWRPIRPILRPFVSATTWVLVFMHENLNIGYGWVLILFGVLMRIILFPLNHKAMRAQLRNMAVQPLLKNIQTKYKDQPERLQKELMKLYKEHGFNPLAGCWPMLLPFPVLIALFFVFQNTIELRGVPFMWLPDLAAQDPLYILPVLLGVSMFFMQWVSFRTMEEINPQMKMMMWLMPIFMAFIFLRFPSGLNLYYVTANIATLPQTFWIARERQIAQAKAPLKVSDDDEDDEAEPPSADGGPNRGARRAESRKRGAKSPKGSDAGAAKTGGAKGAASASKPRK